MKNSKRLIKNSTVLLFLFLRMVLNAQVEHCESTNELEDLYVITKCSVDVKKDGEKKKTKNKSEISLKVKGSTLKRNRIKRKKVKALDNKLAQNISVTEVWVEREKNKAGNLKLIENLSKKVSALEVSQSIPLSAVKNVPLFKNCRRTTRDKSLSCFNEKLSNHIQEHFVYPKEVINANIQGDVWVRFIINKEGEVTNVQVRGPKNGEMLEQEVKLVIAKLPKFTPGTHNGKNINVKYTFPINFEIE